MSVINVKQLRERAKMNMTEFAAYFDIPYRTYQKWDNGTRECSDYLIKLMEYKLIKEGIIDEEEFDLSDSEKNICGTCVFCMPQNELDGKYVCAAKYYGKILTSEDRANEACDEYEMLPF